MSYSHSIIIAVIAALAPTCAVVANYVLSGKKLDQIHKLVNNQLDKALARIDTLKNEVQYLQELRPKLATALERIDDLNKKLKENL